MMKVQRGVTFLCVLVTVVVMAQAAAASNAITVDCSQGQSLNQTLAKLNKNTPITVSVNGTCTEYVHAIGFHNLALKGLPGATLAQPSTSGGNLANGVLYIESSTSVLVSGFSVQAQTGTGAVSAINIGHGSSDIRLRHLNITGGGEGITVFENSRYRAGPRLCHARHL
jgi:pectate lyase